MCVFVLPFARCQCQLHIRNSFQQTNDWRTKREMANGTEKQEEQKHTNTLTFCNTIRKQTQKPTTHNHRESPKCRLTTYPSFFILPKNKTNGHQQCKYIHISTSFHFQNGMYHLLCSMFMNMMLFVNNHDAVSFVDFFSFRFFYPPLHHLLCHTRSPCDPSVSRAVRTFVLNRECLYLFTCIFCINWVETNTVQVGAGKASLLRRAVLQTGKCE